MYTYIYFIENRYFIDNMSVSTDLESSCEGKPMWHCSTCYLDVWVPNTWLKVSPLRSDGKAGLSAWNTNVNKVNLINSVSFT